MEHDIDLAELNMALTAPEMVDQVDPLPAPGRAEAPVLLRARDLRKAFGGQVVLDGIDLELRQGEVVLLRGENGSGKTTLLNILTGNLEPDAGSIDYLADGSPRSYCFPRRWWQELNPWDHFRPEFVAREDIGRTWQDVRLFGTGSLRDNIAVAERGHPGENPLVALFAPGCARRREAELSAKADDMLARLGLAGRESSSADMVSLGQSKRVAIARAVAAGARILFLDEPLAGLDRQGITDVLALLESLVREEKLTLVIVEHVFNQPHLHGLVTTDWLLENGRIHRNGTQLTQSAIRNPQSAIQSRLAGDDAEVIDEPLPRGATLIRIRLSNRWKPDSKPILEIKDLIVKRGPRTVIGLDGHGDTSGFNLTLHEGEIAIIQAPNGWGKSTLFEAICGNATISSGSIRLHERPIESMPPWDRARSGLSPCPSAATLFPSLKVSEAAGLSLNFQALHPSTLPFANRTVSSLSGGEKQRILLRLFLPRPQTPGLALLDEPFAMLDDHATLQAVDTLIGLHPGHAILLLLPAYQRFN